MYATFLKISGFKYDMDMDMSDMDVVDTKTNTNTKTQTTTNTKCLNNPMGVLGEDVRMMDKYPTIRQG